MAKQSSVRLGECPDGWNLVVIQAIVNHGYEADVNDFLSWDSVTRIVMEFTGIDQSIMDHWGAVEGEFGVESLVCEPYRDHSETAQKMAEIFKVDLISGEAPEWHTSCHRYRFEIPRLLRSDTGFPLHVELIAKLIDCMNWEFDRHCEKAKALRNLTSNSPSAN